MHPAATRVPWWRRLMRPMSRDKADTLVLLGACTLVWTPHAEHLPAWITMTCAMLLLWRSWVTFRGNRMPPRWILLPIVIASMAGVYLEHRTFFGRDAGVAMLVLLLSFKLLEMRAKRDLFVVIFLSFFLVLSNFFYSQSIGTALLMMAAVIALLTAQLSFQYTGAVPPLRKRLALSTKIFALAAPLMLVLFVLFPRIQGPLWGMPGDANAGRTGLSDQMSPGNISKLALSDDIAFRVKFIDPVPPKSKLYWRGIVLGDYDGRTWTHRPPEPDDGRPTFFKPRGRPIRHQVTLEPSGRRWLFALEHPAMPPRLYRNPTDIAPDMQPLAARPINERIRYDAASYIDFELEPDGLSSATQPWLALPPAYNPATLAFAAKLRQKSSDPVALANAVLAFFREEKFSYTLEPPLLGQHAIDEFLFGTKAGFCEHYAGAFVVLMRAAGIPARVVTGYQGGDLNPLDGYMTVRQSDAHAWAEIWVKNRGWLRIDPTGAVAPDRIETNLATAIPNRGGLANLYAGNRSWLSSLRVRWDALTNEWNQWVLNYTPEKQKSLVQSLGFSDVNWRTLTALMFGLGAAVTALIVVPLVRNRVKLDPVVAVYLAMCRQMARRGMAKAQHEGPRAYAARLTAADSPLPNDKKMAVADFLKLYEALRYEKTVPGRSPATLSTLKSLLAKCR